jgi:hypothetical protein
MNYAFYKGFKVTVDDAPSRIRDCGLLIKLVEDLRYDTNTDDRLSVGHELLVSDKDIAYLITDLFKVGTHVQVDNSIKGIVTAHEHGTNKAVIKAIHDNRQGIRIIIGSDRLSVYEPDEVRFTPGKWYIINGVDVLAVESVFRPGEDVMLFNKEGKLIYRDVPKITTHKKLAQTFFISTIF